MKKTLTLFGATVVTAALLSAQEAKTAAKAGDAEKGKETFEQCGACHSIEKDEKKMGPSLHGLYKRAKMNNGKKPTDATVKEIINKGGNGMPAYEDLLSDEERNNLIAYLKTL